MGRSWDEEETKPRERVIVLSVNERVLGGDGEKRKQEQIFYILRHEKAGRYPGR